LVYCGTEDILGSIEQAKFSDSYALADGTWKASCGSSAMALVGRRSYRDVIQYVIKGGSWTATIQKFTTEDCSGDADETYVKKADFIVEGDAESPTGAKNVRYRFNSVVLTPGTTKAAYYNEQSVCEKTDWAANTPVELINIRKLDCWIETAEDTIWWYDIAQIVGTDLQLGWYPDSGGDGTVRPTELGTRKYTKQ
jgi:hypothetical protein